MFFSTAAPSAVEKVESCVSESNFFHVCLQVLQTISPAKSSVRGTQPTWFWSLSAKLLHVEHRSLLQKGEPEAKDVSPANVATR